MDRHDSLLAELQGVAVVDNHCHAVELDHGPVGLSDWRQRFSEADDVAMRTVAVADTAFYRRLMHELGGLLGCGDDEHAVLEARAALGGDQLIALLFKEARIGAVLLDEGFAATGRALGHAALRELTGVGVARLQRLEVLFESLLLSCSTFAELSAAVVAEVAGARASGYCGLKSIVGYRTGLGVERWAAGEAQAAFVAARQEVERTGRVRLGHKPLLDSLLHLAFTEAVRQELPVQFHVGYGDRDVDLRKASPLELRALIADPAYAKLPIVLLHGCWPFTREGAFLASVYPHVHLDLSYGIPFLARTEMAAMTRAAFAVAPVSKLLYSSDGARSPEVHWLGAREGRRAIASALGELVSDADIDASEASRFGAMVLEGNARHLYGLPAGSGW